MNERVENLLRTTTVTDFIYKGSIQDITTESLAYLEKLKSDDEDIVFIFDTIISKYIHCLRPFILTIDLSDSELYDYKFQPKKFCLDMYGTMELWSSLLFINNMVSITEFNKKKIKVFNTQIIEVIEDILALVENDIETNRNRVR